jgi:hypothetical protein
MKAKTIKQVIRKKVDAWLESIEDADLRDQLKRKVIVTGGCIASMLLKEPVNDFDIYLRDRDSVIKLARYYVKKFQQSTARGIPCVISVDESNPDRVRIVVKSAGIASEGGTEKPYEYFESSAEGEGGSYVAEVMDNPGDIQDQHDETEQATLEQGDDGKPHYRPVFLSTNAITLSDRVQIVMRFFGEPDEIHSSYDFVHCTNYWTSWDNELVLKKEALEALLTKELRYVGSKYPLCSIIRLRKFIARGWSVNAGQILKAAMQLNELDLNNIEVLQDQLTGVDAAYFCEIMSKLKEKDPSKINTAYLIEIVDRMF